MGEFEPVRWSWRSRDSDMRSGYLNMTGKVTLADLIAHLREIAPDVTPDQLHLNFATASWVRPATEEEMRDRQQLQLRREAAQEKWEREMLTRLLRKYDVGGEALARLSADLDDDEIDC